jgi:hypothetical protein
VSDEEILRRLDLLQATFQLAFKPQFDEVRDRLRSDPVIAAILDATDEWVGTTDLQKRVSESAGVSTRTVRDRLPGLVEDRVLTSRGEGRPEYRKTGLI